MIVDEYQVDVLNKLNDLINMNAVLLLIVTAFMLYLVIHNMMNRR